MENWEQQFLTLEFQKHRESVLEKALPWGQLPMLLLREGRSFLTFSYLITQTLEWQEIIEVKFWYRFLTRGSPLLWLASIYYRQPISQDWTHFGNLNEQETTQSRDNYILFSILGGKQQASVLSVILGCFCRWKLNKTLNRQQDFTSYSTHKSWLSSAFHCLSTIL